MSYVSFLIHPSSFSHANRFGSNFQYSGLLTGNLFYLTTVLFCVFFVHWKSLIVHYHKYQWCHHWAYRWRHHAQQNKWWLIMTTTRQQHQQNQCLIVTNSSESIQDVHDRVEILVIWRPAPDPAADWKPFLSVCELSGRLFGWGRRSTTGGHGFNSFLGNEMSSMP